MRRSVTSFVRIIALVGVVAAGQTAALSHLDIDDAHPAGETCVLCIAVHSLGTANLAALPSFDGVAARAPRIDYLLTHVVGPSARHRLARGPPQAS